MCRFRKRDETYCKKPGIIDGYCITHFRITNKENIGKDNHIDYKEYSMSMKIMFNK